MAAAITAASKPAIIPQPDRVRSVSGVTLSIRRGAPGGLAGGSFTQSRYARGRGGTRGSRGYGRAFGDRLRIAQASRRLATNLGRGVRMTGSGRGPAGERAGRGETGGQAGARRAADELGALLAR